MPHDCLTTALFGIASDLSCLTCLATSHLFSKNPNFEETTTHPLGSRLGHVDKMNSEELRQIEIVPRYVVNKNRYFQCEGWPTEDSPDDDSEKPDDHIGDSLCDQYGITADTYSLCALCRSTFSEKLYKHLSCPERRFQHHRWSQVLVCSSKGCRLCKHLIYVKESDCWDGNSPASYLPIIITREIGAKCDTWTSSTIRHSFTRTYSFAPDTHVSNASGVRFPANVGLHAANIPMKVQIYFTTKGSSDAKFERWKYCLPIFAMKGDPAAEFEPNRGHLDVSSSDATNKIRNWLHACSEHHPHCCLNDTPILPTRVVDIQTMSLHTSPPGETAQYTALSYRWGGDQPFRTTRDSFSAKLGCISTASMPKTLQDAVFVTRQLGIRYLWIDSLCIIQDDPLDMARELSTMHTVYKNATIVIPAEFPTNVHQGFLKQPMEEAIKLPFGHEGGVEGMVHVGPDPNTAKYEALNTRAWVFQETVLARRLLIYSQKGVTWSCISDHIQSNCFEPHTMNVLVEQIRASRGAFGHPDLRGTYGFIDRVPKKDGIESVLDLLHTWHHLVEEYTPLELTFSHDRLPALAGIAREFQSMINDRYIAGLWADDMDRQLAWSRNPRGVFGFEAVFHPSSAHRPTESQAPSWSWASVTCGVTFSKHYGPYDQPLGVQILACHVEPLYEQAPFGRVKNGSLELEAFLCPLKDLPNAWLETTFMDRFPYKPPTKTNPQDREIPCMILGSENKGIVEGLFLEPVPVGPGVYRRIGIFHEPEWMTYWGDYEWTHRLVDDLPKGITKQRITLV